jgi:transcriptional regulator with XRE-family HTH domain
MTGTVAASTGELRRAELGQFLKARRARLSPAELGLPQGSRRRATGLRREEVAALAGVGMSWYTWLEQGRPINVSSQVLDALARTLQLDATERIHMYHLADATPHRSGVTANAIPEAIHDVLHSLDPLPAVLINGRFDVIAANNAHTDLLSEWHTLPCIHKNMLWCHVTEPNARNTLLNYDTEIPYAVARLRADYAQHVGDPEWDDDIRRLATTSEEFGQLWARHDVAKPESRTRHLHHPQAGQLALVISELEVTTMPGLRIEVATPADAETYRRLPLTRPSGQIVGAGEGIERTYRGQRSPLNPQL